MKIETIVVTQENIGLISQKINDVLSDHPAGLLGFKKPIPMDQTSYKLSNEFKDYASLEVIPSYATSCLLHRGTHHISEQTCDRETLATRGDEVTIFPNKVVITRKKLGYINRMNMLVLEPIFVPAPKELQATA